MRIVASVCLLLTLVACSQPRTQVPQVSEAERLEEMQRQKQMSNGAVKLNYDEVKYSKEEKAAMEKQLQRIVKRLSSEATKICFELEAYTENCDLNIELSDKEKGLNAHADGKKIVVNTAMVDFTRGEDEQLAFVIAHEYVHHMMGHVKSAQQNVLVGTLGGLIADIAAASQGIKTDGQFAQLGAQTGLLSYSPSFEQEADYIALYMLERAGFDTARAPDFWRRMARNNPQGIYNRSTHPTTPERFVMMGKTIEEIKMKKNNGQKLLPNLLPEDA